MTMAISRPVLYNSVSKFGSFKRCFSFVIQVFFSSDDICSIRSCGEEHLFRLCSAKAAKTRSVTYGLSRTMVCDFIIYSIF